MRELELAGGGRESDAAVIKYLAFWQDHKPLLAREELAGALQLLENSLRPCGPQRAAELARILIGSYPARAVHDSSIFARAIVSVLAEVPEDLARQAIDELTRENRFLPTRAEIFEACATAAKPRVDALRKARWQTIKYEFRDFALEHYPAPAREQCRVRWERLPETSRGSFQDFLYDDAEGWLKHGYAADDLRKTFAERFGFIP